MTQVLLLCPRKPLYTLILVHPHLGSQPKRGWCPGSSLGDHCVPGQRPSWKLEWTLHFWDHSLNCSYSLKWLPVAASRWGFLGHVGLIGSYSIGVIVWILEILRQGISHRTLRTKEGRSHSTGQGRLDLGPGNPATFLLHVWATSTLRDYGTSLLSSLWPMGETSVYSLRHLEILGPDKNKEFSRFSAENGRSHSGDWLCIYLSVCVYVSRMRARAVWGFVRSKQSLPISQSKQGEMLGLEELTQVGIT